MSKLRDFMRDPVMYLAEKRIKGKTRPPLGRTATAASAFGVSPFNIPMGNANTLEDRLAKTRGKSGWMSYDIYYEMMDTDPDITHAIEERVRAVTGLDSQIVPYDESRQAKRICDYVIEVIRGTKGWDQGRADLVEGGYVTGRGILENVFDVRTIDGIPYTTLTAVEACNPLFFYHQKDTGALMYSKDAMIQDAVEVPYGKFAVYRFGGRYGNPYGYSMLAPIFLYYWFKKANLKYSGIFNERYAVPAILAVAYEDLGFNEAQLKEVCSAFQVDSQIVLTMAKDFGTSIDQSGNRIVSVKPSDFISFIEPDKRASGDMFNAMHERCKRATIERIKGTDLMNKSPDAGSLALGRAQVDAMWIPTVAADVQRIEEVISDQILKPIAQFAFGFDAKGPRYVIKTDKPKDRESRARFYLTFAQAAARMTTPEGGPIKISAKQLFEDCSLKEPAGDKDSIEIKAAAPSFGAPGTPPEGAEMDEWQPPAVVLTKRKRYDRPHKPLKDLREVVGVEDATKADVSAAFKAMTEGVDKALKKGDGR